MSFLEFDCGCKIPIVDGVPKIDYYSLDLTCPKAWKIYQDGYTQSIFQLESYLGKTWSKKLKPNNIPDAAALISIIRPGCVSSNSPIMVNAGRLKTNGGLYYKTITMEKLYKNKRFYKEIASLNEENGVIYNNKMLDVFPTGKKECFKIKVRRYRKNTAQSYVGSNQYPLECTADHKILTPSGWVELKDLQIGDRIASRKFTAPKKRRSDTIANRHVVGARDKNIDGTRYFQEICYKNYYEKCCCCGWNKANLDVNHIDGNRHTNNNTENLCFMCPNCHREYTLGLITKSQLQVCQNNMKLPSYENVDWLTYEGCESVGVKETYDISMSSPSHNFIAGNIIVHNCLQSEDSNGISLTKVYCDRKNSKWITPADPLNQLLEKTFGINIYQETSMELAKELAGFDGSQQMRLIKGIGKKKADIIFGLRKEFIEGCKKVNKVTEDEANKIFDNIEESARYSFNRSHAVAYAVTGYWTAWAKAHLPKHYICAWLRNAKNEQKPLEEIRAVVSEARRLNIPILPPSIRNLPTTNFFIKGHCVHFGLDSIKGCGQKGVSKLTQLGIDFEAISWMDFLITLSPLINKTQVINMIRSGCFDYTDIDRSKCEYEYNQLILLSKPELATAQQIYGRDTPFELTALIESTIKEGKSSTKRKEVLASIVESLKNPSSSLKDSRDNIIAHEKELMGINISCSAIDKASIPDARDNCSDVENAKNNSTLILVGEITECREIKIKNGKMAGESMVTLQLVDESGSCDCVIFPKELSFYEGGIYDGNVIMAKGKKNNRGGVIIEKVYEV